MLSIFIEHIHPGRSRYPQELSSLPVWEIPAVWQSAQWQESLFASGGIAAGFFIGVFSTDACLGYVFIEIRSVWLRKKAAFALGGPIIFDRSVLPVLLQNAEETARTHGAIFLQYESFFALRGTQLQRTTYKRFIEETTVRIDLTQSLDDILANMKQKGRYNIRIAQKSGVSIREVPLTSENIRTFAHLLSQTARRDGFSVHSETSLTLMLNGVSKYGILLFAYLGNEVIAAGWWVLYGTEALYYYGASVSDPEKRRYMASYLIQWEAMRIAKSKGCTHYDFLGIAPENQPHHRLAWVTDFKMKFGWKVHTWPDELRVVLKPVGFRIFSFLRSIKYVLYRAR